MATLPSAAPGKTPDVGTTTMFYFIDNHAADDGNHVVHSLGCKHMPTDKAYLGNFEHVHEALIEARKDFWNSSSCKSCQAGVPVRPQALRIGNVLIWSPES